MELNKWKLSEYFQLIAGKYMDVDVKHKEDWLCAKADLTKVLPSGECYNTPKTEIQIK